MNTTYLRGELYYADLSKGVGSEQEGYRPVLIIQNDVGNKYSPTVIVAAVTSKVGVKPKLPTHYFLEAGTIGLTAPSTYRKTRKSLLNCLPGKLHRITSVKNVSASKSWRN